MLENHVFTSVYNVCAIGFILVLFNPAVCLMNANSSPIYGLVSLKNYEYINKYLELKELKRSNKITTKA